MKNIAIFLVSCTTLLFFSACQKSDDNNYTVPTTYNFENVDYAGQTTRIRMLEELAAYAKSANTPGQQPLSAVTLQAMYENNQTGGSPFTDPALDGATKQIKDKVLPDVQNAYSDYLNSLATVSNATSSTAAAGQAGIATANNGNTYLLNENGMELAQLVEKGLAGVCITKRSAYTWGLPK